MPHATAAAHLCPIETTKHSAELQAGMGAHESPRADAPGTLRPIMHELLGDIRHVDFFSLDVEGAEFSVVRTIDFSRVRIDTFCIELDGHDKPKDRRVIDWLQRAGYTKCDTAHC